MSRLVALQGLVYSTYLSPRMLAREYVSSRIRSNQSLVTALLQRGRAVGIIGGPWHYARASIASDSSFSSGSLVVFFFSVVDHAPVHLVGPNGGNPLRCRSHGTVLLRLWRQMRLLDRRLLNVLLLHLVLVVVLKASGRSCGHQSTCASICTISHHRLHLLLNLVVRRIKLLLVMVLELLLRMQLILLLQGLAVTVYLCLCMSRNSATLILDLNPVLGSALFQVLNRGGCSLLLHLQLLLRCGHGSVLGLL